MRISDWSSDVCSSDLNASLAVQVHEAQKAVDRFLKQYVQIQANTDAVEGKSIKLSLEQDNPDPQASVLALQTSPHLEALILKAQEQHQGSSSINEACRVISLQAVFIRGQ